MATLDIACLCRAVQVRLTGDAVAQFYCHCDDCQAASGGAYVSVALYPAEAVSHTQGELVPWTLKTMPRKRCAVCGTHVLAEVPGGKQIGVKANLLPAAVFKPTFHENCRYAVVPVVDDLPHYKGYPAAFGGTDDPVGW
ncbi:MAG: GFA family protein [Chitinophagaceae bacterium]|nr:GFA family protein [Rubrivivax sp.]